MTKILEGKWDCSACGTKGIKGRFKQCSQCGDPRDPVSDPSEEPYLTADAEDITNTKLADDLGTDPDWICDHCGQANHSRSATCQGCGDGRGGSHDKTVRTRTYDGIRNEIPKPYVGPKRRRQPAPLPPPIDPPQPGEPQFDLLAPEQPSLFASWSERTRDRVRLGALIAVPVALVVAIIFGVWFMFFQTHQTTLTVTDLTWSRGVEVEEFRTLTLEEFDPPSDARILSEFQAIHHYDHVLDHYRTESYTEQVPYSVSEPYQSCSTRSNGNGTFSQSCTTQTRTVTRYRSESRTRQVAVYRDDPVYRTKYRFEIDRWVTDHFYTVDDDNSESPFWPDNIPGSRGPTHRIGDERRETYVVVGTYPENRPYTEELELDIWQQIELSETFTANVNRQNHIQSVDWSNEDAEG